MKIALVSGILPSGHYTENLASGLNKQKNLELLIYTDKNKKNLDVKNCGKIKLVWSQSPTFIYQIISEILKDKPDIVHFQHEINMFGGLVTAILFPFLLLFSRLTGVKVVTTIHATVDPDQINDDFVKTFDKDPRFIRPILLKIFFKILYISTCLFSDLCIVHTKTAKRVLLGYYPRAIGKIKVVPTTIPLVKKVAAKKKKYFLYFGYIAQRKGLENVISGFKKFCMSHPKSEFQLYLAGGVIKGQESALLQLQKTISNPKLRAKIKYLGFLERKEQEKLYQEAYGVVIPAKLSISASGPLYHAFSHGKFIMASKIGHLKDEMIHNKNGYLVKNSQWKNAFEKAVLDKKLVSKLENGATLEAKARSPFVSGKKYKIIYRSLI